jgi:dihydrofolate reductase
MKLTTTTQVSVDGVMQGNGPSEVERKAGFQCDGWAMGHFDSEAMTFVEQLYQAADAFLFGRWTYDFFAGYWGAMDLGSGPIADALNTRPKYVASKVEVRPFR